MRAMKWLNCPINLIWIFCGWPNFEKLSGFGSAFLIVIWNILVLINIIKKHTQRMRHKYVKVKICFWTKLKKLREFYDWYWINHSFKFNLLVVKLNIYWKINKMCVLCLSTWKWIEMKLNWELKYTQEKCCPCNNKNATPAVHTCPPICLKEKRRKFRNIPHI